MREIGARIAPLRTVFVIGCDAFALLDTWRDPRGLLASTHFAVMTRPPVTAGSLADWIPKGVRDEIEIDPDGRRALHRTSDTWIQLLEISALDVSSSEIRARLREGRSVRYLLAERVERAVVASGIYSRAESPS